VKSLTVAGFVDWVLRHGRTLWIVALGLAVPAALRTGTMYAHLRSDLEELLPRRSPSVVALDELRARSAGHQYLGVVVDAAESRNVPAAERFLDDLAARIRTYPQGLVATVRTGDDEERAFLERSAPLYVDTDDLRTIRGRIEARRDYEVSRASGALLYDDAQPPALDFDDIRKKYDGGVAAASAHRGARFTDEQSHLSVIVVELGGYSTGTAKAAELYRRVQADVASLGGPGHYAPGMRVGYAGDAAIAVEELSALVVDLSRSSLVVLVAVLAAIVLYYRWWRSVVVVVPPLLLATVYSFAVASLPPFSVTVLNSNTAFLGSIIVGNGINFGLILLARYLEERRAGRDVRDSLERSVAATRGGTLAAAAAAGVSYAALALTQFRGFRQFGFIGALGMFFAWGLAYLLMPSLVALVDRGEATRPRPKAARTTFVYWLTRAIDRAPALVAAVTMLVTVVAAMEVGRFRSSDIESDFSRLRRRDTWQVGEGYWGDRMNAVLGRYLTPFAILTNSPDQARAVAGRLRSALDGPLFAGRIAQVRTIDDVLPRDQPAKLELVAQIREALTPRVRAALSPDQQRAVDRFLGDDALSPVSIEDLPRSFTLGLRENDGRAGEIVLVYPSTHAQWWDGDRMIAFVAGLRELARNTSDGPAPRIAGGVALSADIVQAIARDGPLASAVAFAGVVGIVVALLRKRRTALYVVGCLVVGVLWLAGASRLLGIRVNFANFIAFPITFGIGVDYAVNVIGRWEHDGTKDILAAVRSTGAAVALCSLTTIIGYSSLLMAQNRALFLFGLLAVLGEITALAAALVSFPALVLLARRVPRSSAISPSEALSPRSADRLTSAASEQRHVPLTTR
jgi:predicted RND superfamily exporter protein